MYFCQLIKIFQGAKYVSNKALHPIQCFREARRPRY